MGSLIVDARREADPGKARQLARMAGVGDARHSMPGPCPFTETELPLAIAWAEGVLMMLHERERQREERRLRGRIRAVDLRSPQCGGYIHLSAKDD